MAGRHGLATGPVEAVRRHRRRDAAGGGRLVEVSPVGQHPAGGGDERACAVAQAVIDDHLQLQPGVQVLVKGDAEPGERCVDLCARALQLQDLPLTAAGDGPGAAGVCRCRMADHHAPAAQALGQIGDGGAGGVQQAHRDLHDIGLAGLRAVAQVRVGHRDAGHGVARGQRAVDVHRPGRHRQRRAVVHRPHVNPEGVVRLLAVAVGQCEGEAVVGRARVAEAGRLRPAVQVVQLPVVDLLLRERRAHDQRGETEAVGRQRQPAGGGRGRQPVLHLLRGAVGVEGPQQRAVDARAAALGHRGQRVVDRRPAQQVGGAWHRAGVGRGRVGGDGGGVVEIGDHEPDRCRRAVLSPAVARHGGKAVAAHLPAVVHVAQPPLCHEAGVEQGLLRDVGRRHRRPGAGAGGVDLQQTSRRQGADAKAQSGAAPGSVVQRVALAMVVDVLGVVLDVGLTCGIVRVGEGQLRGADHPCGALDDGRTGRSGGHRRVVDRCGVKVEDVLREGACAARRDVQGHRRGEILPAVVDVADASGIDVGLGEALEGAQRHTVLLQAAVPRAGAVDAVEGADREDDLTRRDAAGGKAQQIARHRDGRALGQQHGLAVGQWPHRRAAGGSADVVGRQLRTRHRRRVGLAAAATAGARQRQRQTEVEGAQRVGEAGPHVDAALPHEILALRVPAQRQRVVAHLEGKTVAGLAAGIVDRRLHILHPTGAHVGHAEGGAGQQLRVVHQQVAVRRRRRDDEGDARFGRIDVGGRQHLRRQHDPVVVAATVQDPIGPGRGDGGTQRAPDDPHRVVVDRLDVQHDARAGRQRAGRAQPATAVGDGDVEAVIGRDAARVDAVVGVTQPAAVGVGDDEAAGDVLRAQGAGEGLRHAADHGLAREVQRAVGRQAVQPQVQHVVAWVPAAFGGDEQPDRGLRDAPAGGIERLTLEDAAAARDAGRLVDGCDDQGDLCGVGVGQRCRAIVDLDREAVCRVLRCRAAGGVHIGQQAVTQLRQVESRARADRVAVQRQDAARRGVGEGEDDLLRRLLAALQVGVGECECLRQDGRARGAFRHRLQPVGHGGWRVGHGTLQQTWLGRGEPGRIESQCRVDRPGALLEHPVALRTAAAGRVVGGRDIGLRQPGDAVDQRLAVGTCAHAAAVQQDVRIGIEERRPPRQLAGHRVGRLGRGSLAATVRVCAERQVSRRAV